MKKLIIFSIGEQAEIARYYFTNDGDYEVIAFTIDCTFKDIDRLFDLPII